MPRHTVLIEEFLNLFGLQSHPLNDVVEIGLKVEPLRDFVHTGLAPAGDKSLREAELVVVCHDPVCLLIRRLGGLIGLCQVVGEGGRQFSQRLTIE